MRVRFHLRGEKGRQNRILKSLEPQIHTDAHRSQKTIQAQHVPKGQSVRDGFL